MISSNSNFPVPLRVKTKVFLIDDHLLVRAGLKALIDATPDLQVCGEAEDSATALRKIRRAQPHVVMVDLSLKKGSGLELVQRIRQQLPAIRIVVLSIYDESIYAVRSFKAGAFGYLSKHLEAAQVLEALRKVGRGERIISNRVIERIFEPSSDELLSHPSMLLSDRELEIARRIGQGFTGPAIASSLKLSVRAVEFHRRRLRQKLKLSSGPELLRFCCELAAGNLPESQSAQINAPVRRPQRDNPR